MAFERWVRATALSAIAFLVIATGTWVRADENNGSGEAQMTEASSDGAKSAAMRSKKKSKGKRGREKEAEGTQAPNHFEADPILKSKYLHEGQPLEVDPD